MDESHIAGAWAANALLRVEVLSVKNIDDLSAAITVGTLGITLPLESDIMLGKISRDDFPEIIQLVWYIFF